MALLNFAGHLRGAGAQGRQELTAFKDLIQSKPVCAFMGRLSMVVTTPNCGRHVRGALAGNGGTMAGNPSKSASPKKSALKKIKGSSEARAAVKAGKPTRRRTVAKAPIEEPQPTDGADVAAEDGEEKLQEAANHAVAVISKQIADNLAKKASKGNTTCAKFLMELIKARKQRKTPKKRTGVTGAQQLDMEENWKEPQAPQP